MLEQNLSQIKSNIQIACEKSRKDTKSITLVAVSKNQSAKTVLDAANLGIINFGENKIQEAEKKFGQINTSLPNNRIIWHFIGRLQSNKVKKAVSLFELIHSVDSFELAKQIDDAAKKQNKTQKILLQVNVSGEKSKTGFSEAELIEKMPQIMALTHISILGLMTIAPISTDAENSRLIFRKLADLRHTLEKAHSISLPHLSMGMSQDYGVAIEEGATMVRIGSAVFA